MRLKGRKEAVRRKEISGRWKVRRAVSTSRQYLAVQFSLSFSITSFSLSMARSSPPYPVTLYCLVLFTGSCSLPHYSCFKHTHKLQSQFNHQLKMTAGTEREEKGIVQVCEDGVESDNATEKERGGGGMCDRHRRERMRKRRQTERGTPSSNKSWG